VKHNGWYGVINQNQFGRQGNMKSFRYLTFFAGIVTLVLALGFVFQSPIATNLWPWPDGRYSYLFIGSILAAASVAMLWIGWTGLFAALPAGALNIFVIALSTGIYFLWLALGQGRSTLLIYGIASLLTALASGGAFLWSRRLSLSDPRPTPLLVRLSFGIFIVSLFFAGGALLLGAPIFPWDLNPDTSILFGCIFIGDAFYFLYGLFRPRWQNAFGQLLSFLAYDLVLIVPFLALSKTVDSDRSLGLIVYIVVLLYSGALAVYYLFIDAKTRLGS
jgi:hypothetical protein